MKMPDRPLPLRYMIFVWPLMLALGACTVSDSTPMSSVLEQTLDEARPTGVVFDQIFEEEVDGPNSVRVYKQRWKYVATNEADLVAAANQLLDTAVQQGWTLLDPYDDSSVPGFYVTILKKGQMFLMLNYTTTAFFAVLPDDEDELSMEAEISLDQPRESRG